MISTFLIISSKLKTEQSVAVEENCNGKEGLNVQTATWKRFHPELICDVDVTVVASNVTVH